MIIHLKNLKCIFVLMGFLLGFNLNAQELAMLQSNGQYDWLSGSSESITLEVALDQLSDHHDVFFTYDIAVVKNITVQDPKTKKGQLEKDLESLLLRTGLTYQKIGSRNYVIIHSERKVPSSDESLDHEANILGNLTKIEQLSFQSSGIRNREIRVSKLDKIIRGKVTDSNDGTPLTGVNVYVLNSSTGTVTDFDGNYELSVPDETPTLVFSYTGYATQEVLISNQTVLNVVMVSEIEQLGEVVITALGIQKEAKKLGYSATTVGAEEINVNRSSNFMKTLQGKVAGVNISSLGTGPGGTSKVRIRGQSSISGQNNPLIVINGVPIDNTNFGTNPGNNGTDGALGTNGGGVTSDGGDGLQSINPDDIESMTVLKGAAAAALYGSRAKDGVIMIKKPG